MDNFRCLIFGQGYFGKKFHEHFRDSILSGVRIKTKEDVLQEIKRFNPDVVINCAGKTGNPNIDWCEDHKMESIESNILVPHYVALACQELKKKMVHIGSGCVYNGYEKVFDEEDPPNYFGSFYSITKIISEKILNEFDNVLQVRMRLPISSDDSSRNLINKLLKYNKIINVQNSISAVDDAIKATEGLLKKGETGIFNVVNPGPITHKEILDIFQKVTGKKHDYEIVSLEELDKITKAGRSNCILSIEKLKKVGIHMPDTKKSVEKCFLEYGRAG